MNILKIISIVSVLLLPSIETHASKTCAGPFRLVCSSAHDAPPNKKDVRKQPVELTVIRARSVNLS
jgi:hypothetical protein